LKSKQWRPVALVIAGGLVLVLLAILQASNLSSALNADAIYPLVFAKDLLIGGQRYAWDLPPANGFFPDVPTVLAALLVGLDGYANFTAWLAAFAVMLAGATWFFLESFGQERHVAACVSLFCVSVLVLTFARNEELGMLYLSPDFHQSAMIAALVILGIQRQERWSARTRFVALAVVVGVGAASDPILIPQGVLPALALWGTRADRRPATLVGLVVGTVVSFLLRAGIELVAPVHHGSPGSHLALTAVAQSFLDYAEIFSKLLAHGSLTRGWLGVGCLIVLGVYTARGRDVSLRNVALALATATGFAVLGPLMAGIKILAPLYRQQLPLFYFPALGAVTLAVAALNRIGRAAVPALPLVGVVISIAVNRGGFSRLRSDPLLVREGEVVRQLSSRGIDLAIATYWSAKPIWLHSHGHIGVCQIGPDARHFHWIVNNRWCDKLFSKSSLPVVVVANAPWPSLMDSALGPGLGSEIIAGYELRYYPRAKLVARLAP
jgi:hypothetical protein